MARKQLWTYLAAALVAAASILFFLRTYKAESNLQRQVLVQRGQTVLDALAAGIRAHGRMGPPMLFDEKGMPRAFTEADFEGLFGRRNPQRFPGNEDASLRRNEEDDSNPRGGGSMRFRRGRDGRAGPPGEDDSQPGPPGEDDLQPSPPGEDGMPPSPTDEDGMRPNPRSEDGMPPSPPGENGIRPNPWPNVEPPQFYFPNRLTAIFTELAAAPGIVGVQLRTTEGESIAEGGECEDIDTALDQGSSWVGTNVVVSKATDVFGPGFRRGEGRDGPPMPPMLQDSQDNSFEGLPDGFKDSRRAFPQGPYVLAAVLDGKQTVEQISRERAQFILSSTLTLAAIVLAASAVILRFNRAGLEKELTVARERAAQQEEVARMGAGLAHETKNPLGVVRGLAQSITARQALSDETNALAAEIVDEVDRTIGQINSFLELARPKEPNIAPTELAPFLKHIALLLSPDADASSIGIECDAAGLSIYADADLLRRCLTNLVLNAMRASKPGDTVRIRALRDKQGVSLCVADTGCGIDPDDLMHVLEPYFTRFEGGTGLGLATVKQIAHAHGWDVRVESAPGRGTQVWLTGIAEVG